MLLHRLSADVRYTASPLFRVLAWTRDVLAPSNRSNSELREARVAFVASPQDGLDGFLSNTG